MPTEWSSTACYCVTTATHGRRRLFQVDANARMFMETLQEYRREGRYRLHAFVMADNVHLLISPCGITIERAVGLIKGGFSRRLGRKFPVWQKSYNDRRMRDAAEFLARREYIHLNPVRTGLVERAEDYLFSSAYRRTSGAKSAGLDGRECHGSLPEAKPRILSNGVYIPVSPLSCFTASSTLSRN